MARAEAEAGAPPSARSDRGLVVTSHPLAVEAGLEALRAGGTAVDAAVAAAAVLCVVDPRSTGVGGDLFALVWSPGDAAPIGLAAAGPAPDGLSMDALAAAGFRRMPTAGAWTVTVPGAVAGWDRLLDRFGGLGLGRVLRRAAILAEEGFEVTPIVAEEWASTTEKLRADAAASDVFLPGGRAPRAGERFANPALGGVLRLLAEAGTRVFYTGEIADRIGEAVRTAGGPLRSEDLAGWIGPEWVEPIRAEYRGTEIYELPPPGQGLVVLQALGILGGLPVGTRTDRVHAALESLKLGFADARAHVADPAVRPVPVSGLLSPSYLERRRGLVDMARAGDASAGNSSDTVYVAVVDGDGRACSLIQSLYEGFGSGVGVPGTGIVLQNRGSGFTMADGHPNRPEPGKRPYHTIIPAMLGRDGDLAGVLGVVGGFMQPQGQVQILQSLLDEGLDPWEAVARPRFRFLAGRRVGFEHSFDPDIVRGLGARGHVTEPLSRFEAGGAQLILRDGDVHVGASDPRKDGYAGVP